MSEDNLVAIIVAFCAAGIPATVNLITYFAQRRRSRRNSAGHDILLLIMQDQINWELFDRLPANCDTVTDEYDEYHKAGGNGKITKSVQHYEKWLNDVNSQIRNEISSE